METKSTCSYCGVGCGVIIEHDATRITGVRGDPEHPANFGRMCTKGSTLHLTVTPQALAQRMTHPQLRRDKNSLREKASWDTALDHAADRFAQAIADYGPDSVAFYISGQLLTEDYYVFNKLAKGLIGTNNVDTNSRLCMSSAVSVRRGSTTISFIAGRAFLASSMRRNSTGCAHAVLEPAISRQSVWSMSS